MRIVFFAALTLLALPVATQSGPDFEALDAQVRYRLDDDGQILIAPDPSAGSPTAGFTPLVHSDYRFVLPSLGSLGWAMLVFGGDTDVASLSDSEAFFMRLGHDDDASLIATIGDGQTPVLQRLLAVRRVQARGAAAAMEVLERLQDVDDAHLRRAALEARAAIDDQPIPDHGIEVPPLAEVLAAAPADTEMFIVVDQRRLPPARALSRWSRIAGLEGSKREIRAAGGTVSTSQWAGARRISERAGALPYELARRFGNARVNRVVAALRPFSGESQPDWIRVDGEFDVRALRLGLAAAGIDTTGEGEVLEYRNPRMACSITPGAIEVVIGAARDPLGGELAAEHASGIEGDAAAPIVGYLVAGRYELPFVTNFIDGSREVAQLPAGRIAVTVPRRLTEPLQIRAECGSAEFADSTADWFRQVPRWAELALEGLESETAKAFDPLLDALDAMTIEQDGSTVTASVSLAGVDLEQVVLAAARAGLVR